MRCHKFACEVELAGGEQCDVNDGPRELSLDTATHLHNSSLSRRLRRFCAETPPPPSSPCLTHPTLFHPQPKKHCKSCGRAFALELVAFSVGGSDDALMGARENEQLNISDI